MKKRSKTASEKYSILNTILQWSFYTLWCMYCPLFGFWCSLVKTFPLIVLCFRGKTLWGYSLFYLRQPFSFFSVIPCFLVSCNLVSYPFEVWPQRRFYYFFEFCTAPVSSLLAEGVIAEVRESTESKGNSSFLIVRGPPVLGQIPFLYSLQERYKYVIFYIITPFKINWGLNNTIYYKYFAVTTPPCVCIYFLVPVRLWLKEIINCSGKFKATWNV